jgi:GNAT superfamily N-acetyltransferase
LQIEIVEESAIHPDLDSGIRALLVQSFPEWANIFAKNRIWHSSPPIFTVLGWADGSLVGHIAVVVRTITTTWNFRYNVASIQGVCVVPEQRRNGLATQLLAAALSEIQKRNFSFAILFCKEPLVPFYEAQGWKLTDDSVVMWNQRDLPVSMRSNCPMYYELGDFPMPEGPLDVHSPSWE